MLVRVTVVYLESSDSYEPLSSLLFMSFPKYKEIELPLLRFLADRPDGSAEPSELYDVMADYFHLAAEERIVSNPSESKGTKWETAVRFASKSLKDRGELDDDSYGIWKITDRGRQVAGVQDFSKILPDSSQPVSWWWVNQGQSYKEERNGGFIWAPQRDKRGTALFHHVNVSKVKKGDLVLHYVDGRVVSTSIAESDAEEAAKPDELPKDLWERDGYIVKVKYFDLEKSVPRDEIPIELRMALGKESKTPFTSGGAVNQGYLFSLPTNFVSEVCRLFPQLVPPGGTPLEMQTDLVMKQFIEELKNLRVDTDKAGAPPLYKPGAILAIIDALDSGELVDNEIEFSWLVPRFTEVLANLGKIGDERKAAAAFFHMQNEPFWKLKLKQNENPPVRGEPAQLRNTVDFAYFAKPYWTVLRNDEQRRNLKEVLMETWFGLNGESLNSESFDFPVALARLVQDINESGFRFEPWQIASYVTALRTKPFVILAGISGSGKSQLPQLVATATGSSAKLIPVRPDWTDSSDILGYVQLQGRLRPGPLLELASEAQDSQGQHFACIVDEMNLARVEHYFAEILSRIEESRSNTRECGPLLSLSLPAEDKHWHQVVLTPNLSIVGTVNMDETTHGFSRKVLDRAFTLEFSEIDLLSWEIDQESSPDNARWPITAWLPRARRLAELTVTDSERTLISNIIDTVVEVNEILSQAQLQLAYRSRDEIVLFVLHANEVKDSFKTSGGNDVDPLDLALQMKVLPRIAGGSGPIRQLVLELLGWSYKGSIFGEEDEAEAIIAEWKSLRKPHSVTGAVFPRTCARLCLMWDRILHEGYTSYWL